MRIRNLLTAVVLAGGLFAAVGAAPAAASPSSDRHLYPNYSTSESPDRHLYPNYFSA